MKRQRINPVSKKRVAANLEYTKIRAVYLRENPECAVCSGGASEIHHLCRGGSRAVSLVNSDTWLGLCHACHESMESVPIAMQARAKVVKVLRTINRLRGRAENAITLEDLR